MAVTLRAQTSEVIDVEREPLIAAVRDAMVDNRRDRRPVVLKAEHAERLGSEHLGAQPVARMTPPGVSVDIGAEAMPVCLVGLGVLRAPAPAHGGL